MRGIGYASFYGYRIQVAEIKAKQSCPTFFFDLTTSQANGDFDGLIMFYFNNISFSFLHASDLCGVILLAMRH